MHNNLYGTFIADSLKEYLENNIERETVSIWASLVNPTTKNPYYVRSYGVLQFSHMLDACRFWKEYFDHLATRKQDSYGFEPMAEDNDDYLNIAALKVDADNERLRKEIK
jgi:hypothetical protein